MTMSEMKLQKCEAQLKARLALPYIWGCRQNDDWDAKSRIIYKIDGFRQLSKVIEKWDDDLKNYTLNRWYNFQSAMRVEEFFEKHPTVKANKDYRSKTIDFWINEIPFDHKTTVFPIGFNKDIKYAQENERELLKWLYTNQSTGGRRHMNNRIFVIVYDSDGEHWKIKSELSLIKTAIQKWMAIPESSRYIVGGTTEKPVYAGIIWVQK